MTREKSTSTIVLRAYWRSASALIAFGVQFGCGATEWERGVFPEKLSLRSVIASCHSSSLREGVAVAYLQLDPEAATRIRAEGIGYFADALVGRNGEVLRPWAVTPLNIVSNDLRDATGAIVYAWPMRGCNNDDIALEVSNRISAEYEAGRAYYTTFNNGEGLLVVAPDMNLAAYYYFG